MSDNTFTSILHEERSFAPPAAFAEKALVSGMSAYQALVEEANADYVSFWDRQARELLDWASPWQTTLDWQAPFARWFVEGKLNVAYNCLDRHLKGPR